ncbi:MAG: hypothetical protein ACKORJ_07265 [Bacteroidota bacterium]
MEDICDVGVDFEQIYVMKVIGLCQIVPADDTSPPGVKGNFTRLLIDHEEKACGRSKVFPLIITGHSLH